MNEVSLEELGIDDDPGTSWHPRADKEGVRDAEGLLLDLGEEEVDGHRTKPEAAEQPDAGEPMEAEDALDGEG